jgi:hypothetical protein
MEPDDSLTAVLTQHNHFPYLKAQYRRQEVKVDSVHAMKCLQADHTHIAPLIPNLCARWK